MAATEPLLTVSKKKKNGTNINIRGHGVGDGSAPRLLRKPRASKLPPLEVETPPSPDKDKPFYKNYDYEQDNLSPQLPMQSPTPSVVPSLVSPPPSESIPNAGTFYRSNYGVSPQSNGSILRRGDKKYVLDPVYREKTSLGTYVDGKSLVKPFKPRGPDGFPARLPRRPAEILPGDVLFDDIRYYQPPAFTLDSFCYHISKMQSLPIKRVKEAFCSKHNYKKLTKLIAEKYIYDTDQVEVNTHQFTPEDQDIPPVEPRIPQKQLLIEMAAMIKQHVRDLMNTEVKSVIRPLRKYSPSYADDNVPHTEIILYEDDSTEVASRSAQQRQDSEIPGMDSIFHSARSRYFQGSGRSQSPFAAAFENSISPSELAILDALINGGKALSLKAHFILEMPDISPLMRTVTYMNLSFNNFATFPREILEVRQLEILKLRNNPLRELPSDIHRMRNLRILVVSFCLLTNIPMGLFALSKLVHLDISYNKLTFIQNEISNMRNLRELNMEGNQLPAMPCGGLLLDLYYLNVKNNFMHPLFWKENTQNQPQRLIDMASLTIAESDLIKSPQNLPDSVRKVLANRSVCDCCHGPLYGPGMRIIRPVSKLHGINNLPFMFRACSPSCLQVFKHSKETLSEILYGTRASSGEEEEEEQEEEE